VCFAQGFDLAHQGAVFDANFSKSEQRVVSGGGDSLIKAGLFVINDVFFYLFIFWIFILKASIINGMAYSSDNFNDLTWHL